MNADHQDENHRGPYYSIRERREDVIVILWQGVAAVLVGGTHFPLRGDGAGTRLEANLLGKYARKFGMKQFSRTVIDSSDHLLLVQWYWENVGDAACRSPFIPSDLDEPFCTANAQAWLAWFRSE